MFFNKKSVKYKYSIMLIANIIMIIIVACSNINVNATTIDISNIPAYTNEASTAINNDIPYFTDAEKTTKSFETYSKLDKLGRCGVAYANISTNTMPTEKRGSIGMVKPTGWHTVKYNCIKDRYLYNRCHLIAYELAGENANTKNLITGTRYLNITGMLPYENMVADYVKETENHVLYRVTPIFDKNNLVVNGVLIEGYSVEDSGKGICFNRYCYNVQPGIDIDYSTGNSSLSSTAANNNSTNTTDKYAYILNTKTKKIHMPNCNAASKINDSNKKQTSESISELEKQGYTPCKICNPK